MADTSQKYFLQLVGLGDSATEAGNIWSAQEDECIYGREIRVFLCRDTPGGTVSSSAFNSINYDILFNTLLFASLTRDKYELLIAVKALEKRLEIFNDRSWLREGLRIKVGSRVRVKRDSEMIGVVRFCGCIGVGRMFGVELDSSYHGQGTSNGTFRKKKYFSCNDDCAVFVSLYALRLFDHDVDRSPGCEGISPSSIHPQGSYKEYQSYQEQTYPSADTITPTRFSMPSLEMSREDSTTRLKQFGDYPLRIGERIVWMSDNGPEFGSVKWIGVLPGADTDELTVGVEFDNPIGSGTGRYKSHRLFMAERNHASLVPIMGLMKLTDYLPMEPNIASDGEVPTLRQQSSVESKSMPHVQSTALEVVVSRRNTSLRQEDKNTVMSIGQDFGKLDLQKIRESPVIRGRVMPPSIAGSAVDCLCGQDRGLQGQSGSCGLESVIYSLFAFSSNFDGALYEDRPIQKELPTAIKSVLVEQVVNPLRAGNYVSANRIHRFKELVSMLRQPDVGVGGTAETDDGETESEDPAEIARQIIYDLLGIDLSISTGKGSRDCIFRIESFDRDLLIESLQHALERIHVSVGINLTRFPSTVFIVEIKQDAAATNSSGMIFPSPILDVSNIIAGFPNDCMICGRIADLESCSDCFLAHRRSTRSDLHRLSEVTFCKICFEKFHMRPDRKHHQPVSKSPSNVGSLDFPHDPQIKLELYAIVSSIKGHYVSFVLSGNSSDSTWLLFDGMANRKLVERRGEFASEIRQCPEIRKCFEEFRKNQVVSPHSLPELVQNMLGGLRMCFYRPVLSSSS